MSNDLGATLVRCLVAAGSLRRGPAEAALRQDLLAEARHLAVVGGAVFPRASVARGEHDAESIVCGCSHLVESDVAVAAAWMWAADLRDHPHDFSFGFSVTLGAFTERRLPPPIPRDPEVRRWMAMQAAVHADRPWAMTVLAAMGAAA